MLDEFARLLGGGVATKDDLARLTEQLVQHDRVLERFGRALDEHGAALHAQGKAIEVLSERIEEQGKRIEEQGKRIEEQGKRIEEQGKRIDEHSHVLAEHGRSIQQLVEAVAMQGRRIEEAFRRVEAMGARWGLHAESAFREGMRSVLTERFGARVERWEGFDQEGTVYGYPSPVELDVVVRNGGTLVIEVKSHVSRGDIAAFHRKVALYERLSGATAQRLIVSPSVEERALEIARTLGIDVSTSLASAPAP